MRMTIEAFQALYCSSIAFGMRKALQSEQGKTDLQKDVDQLKDERTDLERQLADLRQRAEQADRRAAELRLAEERKHAEEIAFLKKTNQQLKVRIFFRCTFCCIPSSHFINFHKSTINKYIIF